MKKLFTYALAALAATALLASCSKKNNNTDEPDPTPTPTPTPVEEYTGPTQGTSNWGVIGSFANTVVADSWSKDYVMAESNGVFVLKNMALTAADEFKIREVGNWEVNRGGTFATLGEGFAVVDKGDNIKPALEGYYDIYYNPSVEQMAVVAKDGTPTWAEPVPSTGTDFSYVLDIHDYHVNSTFLFEDNTLPLDAGSLTLQFKFWANKWNQHNFHDKDEEGNTLYANRLGEFANLAESQSVLFRFSNDGDADGQLCINAPILGLQQDQVAVGDSAYVWAAQTWHVLTLTSDGTSLKLYDNGTLLKTYSQSDVAGETWKFGRFDISMTWDDGSKWPLTQAFNGYIAYARVWDRALSESEVAASLCDVDYKAEGLKLYWAFNNDAGHVVKNLAGDSTYDLDFTAAQDGNGRANDTSAYAEAGWTPVSDVEGLSPVCAE